MYGDDICSYKMHEPDQEKTCYGDQTRDLFNILPAKLNALLSPLL